MSSVYAISQCPVPGGSPRVLCLGSRPSAAASRERQLFPFRSSRRLSQRRVWATHPADVREVLPCLGAPSLPLLVLSPNLQCP